MRNRFGLLSILLGSVAIIACSEQMAPASASNAKQWVGLWVLKLVEVNPREITLSIREANGEITATLRGNSRITTDKPIEIHDISVSPRSLVLKYEAPTLSSETTTPASMLRIGSDRRVEIHDPSSRTNQIGHAAKVSVSEEFLDSLFREENTESMIKTAQAAGLNVTDIGSASDTRFVIIEDPATGLKVFTRSITSDFFR